MIKEHYTYKNSPDFMQYRFKSIGNQGVIDKFLLFEDFGNSRFNLAFGDIVDGRTFDHVVSNNHDTVKTISTVAKIVYVFLKNIQLLSWKLMR